jgi:ATP-dependent DNA helicase RecQ
MASVLRFPISHNLLKTRETDPQKIFESAISKKENLKGAFFIEEEIAGKKILLIDDIFDSGQTLKIIAHMLVKKGAKKVAPIVIAKTVGGR